MSHPQVSDVFANLDKNSQGKISKQYFMEGLQEFAASNGVTDFSELSELTEISDSFLQESAGGDSFLQGIALSSTTVSAVSSVCF